MIIRIKIKVRVRVNMVKIKMIGKNPKIHFKIRRTRKKIQKIPKTLKIPKILKIPKTLKIPKILEIPKILNRKILDHLEISSIIMKIWIVVI